MNWDDRTLGYLVAFVLITTMLGYALEKYQDVIAGWFR